MSSGASTPSAPKSMSSRLLTMKFMQRAAASSPSISSPPTSDEPSPKRRKKNSDTPSSLTFNIHALADQRAVQAAVDAEEAKRQAALDRQAAAAGDTRWVLSFEDQKGSAPTSNLALRVVQAGYANLDASSPSQSKPIDEEDWDDKPVMVGRRSFGKFNKALEKQNDPSQEDSSETSSENDEGEGSSESSSDEDDPTSQLIKASRQEAAQRAKAERKAQKKAEKAKSLELSKKRKKKEVKLNGKGDVVLKGLTSLSGRQDPAPKACYTCGGPHLQAKCPQNQNKRIYQGPDDGPNRKNHKVK